MKYVWITTRESMIKCDWEVHLFRTNTSFKGGDKVYLNSNGYVQRRANNNFIGIAVSQKRNEHFADLAAKIIKIKSALGDKLFDLPPQVFKS